MEEDMGTLKEEEKLCVMGDQGGPVLAHVKNGEILRVRPLPLKEEDVKRSRWKIEVKGKTFQPPARAGIPPFTLASRRRVYSPLRLKYPMKRVGFEPGGKCGIENRGKGEFVRISWDEAIGTVAGEIKRIREDYGPAAVLAFRNFHHSWGNVNYHYSIMRRFFDLLGTTDEMANPCSWEGWFWGAVHTWGFQGQFGAGPQEDLMEDTFKNSDLIVWWSNDPESTWNNGGMDTAIWRLWLRELKRKQVFIDPFCNFTASRFGDKWIAPRIGTDSALAAAIAHIWLIEGTYDKDYIATHSYGFDQWQDYILGHEDGIPKTVGWAEGITGVKAGVIKALAREWASKRTSLAIKAGEGGANRAIYGHEWARMMVLLQAMQGLGKPGVNIWDGSRGCPTDKEFYFPHYAWPDVATSLVAEKVPKNPVTQKIYKPIVPDSILNPPVHWLSAGLKGRVIGPDAQFDKNTYPEPGQPEVRMIYRHGGGHLSVLNDGNKWVKLFKSPKIEFFVVQTPWMEPEAKFADILLPACTNFEREDISQWARNQYTKDQTNYKICIFHQKCIDPLYESKTDYEIYSLLAEKLGFKEEYTEGNSIEDWVRKVFTKTSIKDHISYEEFKKKGFFIAPFPKDYKPMPALRSFYETGEGLETPSGKIEFFSQRLYRALPDDKERPPVPHYLPAWEGPHSSLAVKYPLQLMTPHVRYSYHSQYEFVQWLREIPLHRIKKEDYYYWPVRIHPADAAARGIKNGEIVRLFNDRAQVLCAAVLTQRIRPGNVHAYHAAWYDPVEPGKPASLDKGGDVNLLISNRFTSQNAPGMVNQCLVEIEKWEDGNGQ
jgi:molybdopterin guanine dinucleotide-containing S/N-oxide reductase-like protein